MKKSYEVTINGLKHEIDAKTKDCRTTLHLELPGNADLRFLQKVFQKFKDPRRGESGHFRLHTLDVDGRQRTFELMSDGTKTKDFVLLAVVTKDFNASDGFEQYFGQLYFEGDPRPTLTFEAELFQHNALLQAADKLTSIDGIESISFSSGGKTVVLGKKDGNPEA